MKKPCRNGLLIHLQIGQYNGHAERMDDIGLPGFALLFLMGLVRNPVSLFDHGDIIRRMIFTNCINQVLIQHFRAGKIGRRFQFDIQFFFCSLICHMFGHLFLWIVKIHYNFFYVKKQGALEKKRGRAGRRSFDTLYTGPASSDLS